MGVVRESSNEAPEPCKVALVGAGNTARGHIRAFTDVPGVTIVGISSRTRSRAETLAAEYHITKVYDCVSELYDKTRAALLVVAVNELSMNSVSRECFEFPWKVLLEKPAGYNLADAEEIYAIAQERNREVFVALNRRSYASTRAARDDLNRQDGFRFVKVQDQEDPEAALAAGQPKLVVDNWMYANSIHLIDYFRIFGRGKIRQVKPVIAWNPGKPSVVVSEIEFESGDIGLYEGIWNAPGPWAVSISTSPKQWELRPLEQAAFRSRGERQMQPVAPHPWDQTFKPGFRFQAEMAVNAALGKPTELPTLGDALETMQLIQAIFAR